jgi:hypothetical protein
MATVVPGHGLYPTNKFCASVFVCIWSLLLGLLSGNDTRDIIQRQSILCTKCQVGDGVAIRISFFHNLESRTSGIRSIVAGGSWSGTSSLGAINNS